MTTTSTPVSAVDALRHGAAYLVDYFGRRLLGPPEDQLLTTFPVWAHLRDGATGQWHVHRLRQASELEDPRLLEMLLPLPANFQE